MKYPLISITGPTASGKSAFAISLAKSINGEIISADSAQIYRDLCIITARTTLKEMDGVPHHLTGFLGIQENFSLAEYQKMAYKAIQSIIKRNKIPILTGGTGLYIKAVLEDYRLPGIPADPEFRKKMRERAQNHGKESLYRELQQRDPVASSRIHPNNLQRVIRALEVIEKTGKTFSFFYHKGDQHPLGIEPISYCLTYPRDVLYDRINFRVDAMFRRGAIDEVRNLLMSGFGERLQELKILGCTEIIYILEGKCTLQEGSLLLKRNTRRYAKRQLTWSRSQAGLSWIDLDEKEEKTEINKICRIVKQRIQRFRVK